MATTGKRKSPEPEIKEENLDFPIEESASQSDTEYQSKFPLVPPEEIYKMIDKRIARKKTPEQSKVELKTDMMHWMIDSLMNAINQAKKDTEKHEKIKYMDSLLEMAHFDIELRVQNFRKKEEEKFRKVEENLEKLKNRNKKINKK